MFNGEPTRVFADQANNFLDFWKVPVQWHSLLSIGKGVTCIGKDVGEVAPQSRESVALHAVRGEKVSIFCRLSAITPGDVWRPLLWRASDDRPLAWSTADDRKFIFAFDVQQAIDDLLSEEYRTLDTAAARTGQLRKLYYRLRPLMPRPVQLGLRKRYAKTQGLIQFPAWPIEDSLMFLLRTLLWCVARASGHDAIPHIAFWPEGKRCCIVLTHDVEQLAGINNIGPVIEIEKKYGLRSLWNFVPRRYPFDRSVLTRLQDDGFEIGVHGLTHDGRLFESRKIFEQRAPAINAYGKEWGSVTFRSPATHRIYRWLADDTLSFLYDSSYPDTDPYQPMPGGCCNVFPWFIGNKVEIPITLPQDHVLFETLRDESSARWHEKFQYVEEQGGMAVMIVHPDYVISSKRLRIYEEFVEFLSGRENAWFALPRDVAEWWVARRQSVLSLGANGSLQVTAGPRSPDQELKVESLSFGPIGGIGANFSVVDGDALERMAASMVKKEARSGL